MDYDQFMGFTQEVIDYVSDLEYFYTFKEDGIERTEKIVFKNEDGTPNLKACAAMLGFDINYPISIVLREEKEVKDRTPDLRVRHPLMPQVTHNTRVYSGKRKADYYPPKEFHDKLRNIFISDSIIHTTPTGNCLFEHIQDIGDYE